MKIHPKECRLSKPILFFSLKKIPPLLEKAWIIYMYFWLNLPERALHPLLYLVPNERRRSRKYDAEVGRHRVSLATSNLVSGAAKNSIINCKES